MKRKQYEICIYHGLGAPNFEHVGAPMVRCRCQTRWSQACFTLTMTLIGAWR